MKQVRLWLVDENIFIVLLLSEPLFNGDQVSFQGISKQSCPLDVACIINPNGTNTNPSTMYSFLEEIRGVTITHKRIESNSKYYYHCKKWN